MKYKYYDKMDRLIAESDSPIKFNVARFPIWKATQPVVEADKPAEKVTDKVTSKEKEKEKKKKKKEDKQ